MSFANIPERQEFESKYQKPTWIRLDAGQYVVRILDDAPVESYKHWVRGVSLVCIGEGCPVCENNAQIREEYPDDFKDVRGYSPRSLRYAVNVLDKTPVKVCPQCKSENPRDVTGQFPPVCLNCHAVLPEDLVPTTVDQVKILDRGVQLFEQFNTVEATINDPLTSPLFTGAEGEKKHYDLKDIDIALIVKGQGNSKTVVPVAIYKGLDPVPEGLEKFDLEKAKLVLDRDEMVNVMSGVRLRDVLIARSSKKEEAVDNSESLLSEVNSTSKNIQESLAELGFDTE